ncbi:ABC transporter ATP-binding protein [Mycoplana ramosa]|uniref:ABC transporter ATP-binding protein n=1 Tax=Mycoplana ramosa TaxID=40837 RepID=A0ABW3YYI1_MYCRA
MSTPISIQGITKSFNDKPALRGIDLEIAQGEMIALLGSSGCGKTTLLRIIAGLGTPDGGRLLFGSKDVTALPVQQRRIGMVFQGYSLFPNMSVRENIAFPLKVAKTPAAAIRHRVEELLVMTGLTERADFHPNQLSGGQQQRTALARALAPKPDVLLLDEPLSALDAQVRTHLRDEIARIQRNVGTTAILVTHDQAEALAIADRVVIMQAGRIEQAASPEELYDSPATEFSASFIGTRNRIELRPEAGALRLGNFFYRPAQDSTAVTLWVRSEDLRVCAPGEGLEARIETRLYQGPVTRLNLIAESPAGDLRLRLDGASRDLRDLRAGDRINVNFRPEDAHVFSA